MSHHGFSSAFSRLFRVLSNKAPNRRARRAMRRGRTSARPALEVLESRVLLSSYIVEDLGTLGGTASLANAINAKGEVVGQSGTSDGAIHAVLWDPGKSAQDLGTLGGTNSSATAINILGEIVGAADTTAPTNPSHPFDLKPGGSMTDLTDAPPDSSELQHLITAKGINDNGVIVGQGLFNFIDTISTSPYAFDPSSGAYNDLDTPDSSAIGEATAVAGTRAVANLTNNNKTQAVVEDINTPNSSVILPAIVNQTQSFVDALSAPNSSGIQFATGYAVDTSGHDHDVLWTIPADPHSATVTDLGHLPGASPSANGGEGIGVNSLGDVVGSDAQGIDAAAFVKYHDGAMTLLNSLLPAGSGINLLDATGINDAGQICADGTINGHLHAFRLTPVPTAPPQATLTYAPDVDSSGSSPYLLNVTFDDSVGIDTSTLPNAIQVTGPGSFSQTASFNGFAGSPTHLVAAYTITPPGGTWDFSDNGTYTVSLNPDAVKTTSGEVLAGGTLGHFVAAINVQRGSISGTVYNDANVNGQRDSGEGGLPNSDVFLDLNRNGTFDGGDLITRTDANGAYSFKGLLPGSYSVMVDISGRPVLAINPAIDVHSVQLSEAQNATGVDFGELPLPQITDIAGQNLVYPHGSTAQFDQPATVLHISGVNFDPTDEFYFGNDEGAAVLKNLQTDAYGVQSFDLQVPKFATSGPLVVAYGNNRVTTLLPNFTVDSYRNVNGYSFVNTGKEADGTTNQPDFTFDELTTVYGTGQTHSSLFGLIDFGPSQSAKNVLNAINLNMPPSNGLCTGFDLSATRLFLGLNTPYSIGGWTYHLDDFPTQTGADDASNVWQLSSPSGPTPDLDEFIRLAHLEESSVEFDQNCIDQENANVASGLSHLIDGVKSELAQGRPILIGFDDPNAKNGKGIAHAVLAYNVEDGANGSETLDVYDPDLPFLASEDNNGASAHIPGVENGSLHVSEVNASTINFSSGGDWTYNGGAGSASGDLGSIFMIPLSVFDSHTLGGDPSDTGAASGSGSLTRLLAFGSAAETQVTDSAGHTLLNADGTTNINSNTRIPNATRFVSETGAVPLDLVEGTGPFMQTITGTGSGTYGAYALNSNATATLSGIATANGQADQFSLDPTTDKLTFIPATAKSLNADLTVNGTDGTTYEAQVSTSAIGGTQTLQIQGGQVEFQAAKKNSSDNSHEYFSFTFQDIFISNASAREQSFSTGRISIVAGDTVDVLPSDWSDLQDATAKVTIHHADGTTTTSTISNQSSGGVLNLKEGVSYNNGFVAAFNNVSSTGLSASIDWGDGTTSTGTVGLSGTVALVGGTHTYAQQGYYTVRTTLSDSDGQLGQATSEAIVSDAGFSSKSATVSAFAGIPFSGKVATLTDASPGDTASDFDVQINWGDGTTSAGTLQQTAAGTFDVIGSHTWATTGNKTIQVAVTEDGSISGQGQTLNIGSNTNFSGTVAQLQLPIPGSDTSDYTATIDWGDGTTSTGTLTLQSDGSVLLTGSHTYATGNKSYGTHVTLTGGPSVSTTSTAVVSPALGTVTGTLFADLNGNGKMDTGEQGIPGQVVFIDENNNGKLDSGEPSAVTNSAGAYTIANAPAGTIRVSEVVPSGFRVSAPASGSYTVTLNAGQTLSKLDLANTKLAQISGTVFIDANGNSKQDPAEPGRANQIVYLDLNNDGVLEATEPTAITDSMGAFAFTVSAGTYVVRLEPFSDFTITTPSSGTYSVTVGAGTADSSGLFGEHLVPPVGPPPPPPHLPPPPPSPAPPPSPVPPPTLHTPPLLALIDSILGGIETINGNHTETVTDSIFGFPLFVSTYDGAGNLMSVTYFGINITFLFA